MVQMEAWVSDGGSAVNEGAFRTRNGAGVGVSFSLTPNSRAALASNPRRWISVEADTHGVTLDGEVPQFGALGDEGLLGELSYVTVSASGAADATVPQPAAEFRLRNVRLVPRTEDCTPCGVVPIAEEPRVMETGDSFEGAQPVLRAAPGSAPLVAIPLDATTLVDPTCNCLRGARVTFDIAFVSESTAVPRVAAVVFASAAGDAVLRISDIDVQATQQPASPESDVKQQLLWSRVTANVHLGDHVYAHAMPWRTIGDVRLVVQMPGDNLALPVPSVSAMVRRVRLSRPCPMSEVVLHPTPQLSGAEVDISRTTLGLTRGQSYHVITYETNMWGEVNAPTCSVQFVADDTPPMVTGTEVLDTDPDYPEGLYPIPEVNFTKHGVLQVTWTGTFVEEDSAPDNILLFKVERVTWSSPNGPVVPQLTQGEERLLARVSTDETVTSGELDLVDGETYFAHLGICNVRVGVGHARSCCGCV